MLVVLIGWLYLLPQFQGASVTLTAAIGAPRWLGAVIVAAVVLANVTSGGMRSITFVQAFQYWLKLTALLVPAAFLLVVWFGDGAPDLTTAAGGGADSWSLPLGEGGAQGLYVTYSLIVATFLGTMGLPHVVVRFYTNPDGRAARRTTLVVLGLLGMFYLLPPVYAALGRVYAPELIGSGRSEALVLELPRLMLPGTTGDLLTGLVTAGAFAAFLSTSSGLAIAVAGVLSQDVTGRRFGAHRLSGVTAFRVGAVFAVVVPCALALSSPGRGRRPHGRPRLRRRRLDVLPAAGARHLVARAHRHRERWPGCWSAALGSGAAVGWTLVTSGTTGWPAVLLGQPAAWSVPAAVAHDGGGEPLDQRPGAGAHAPLHGPAARAGVRARRPRLTVRRVVRDRWSQAPSHSARIRDAGPPGAGYDRLLA